MNDMTITKTGRKAVRLLMVAAGVLMLSLNLSAAGKNHYTIMPIGDSITQGSGKCVSYSYPLWKMMKEAGYDFEYIGPRTRTYDVGPLQHCGFGGKTIEYLDKNIDSLYRAYPADVLLLHAGHNHFAEKEPVPGIIESHRSLIDKVLAINPDAIIFVAQVIPSGKLPKYSYIPELDKELKKMVRSYHSRQVILVNASKGFDWEKHTNDDLVHPNAEGAEIMARHWMKVIHRHLKP